MTLDEGVGHGYEHVSIYDGLGDGLLDSNDTNGYDDYDQWFQAMMPGLNPLGTGLDWNTWVGGTYIYPEMFHPTGMMLSTW